MAEVRWQMADGIQVAVAVAVIGAIYF